MIISSIILAVNPQEIKINLYTNVLTEKDTTGYEFRYKRNNKIESFRYDYSISCESDTNLDLIGIKIKSGTKTFFPNKYELIPDYNLLGRFYDELNKLKTGFYDLYFEFKGLKEAVKLKVLKTEWLVVSEYGLDSDLQSVNYENYTVKPGDSYNKIASMFGISLTDLLFLNGLNYINDLRENKKLIPGNIIKVGKVSFTDVPTKIEINLATSKLTLFYMNKFVKEFVIAPGRSDSTPRGYHMIVYKEHDPDYEPDEFTVIPPGSIANGLGSRWLQLSEPQYGIHGTNKPWELGKRISHGCVRMLNAEVEMLDFICMVGTEVKIEKK